MKLLKVAVVDEVVKYNSSGILCDIQSRYDVIFSSIMIREELGLSEPTSGRSLINCLQVGSFFFGVVRE